MMMPLLHPLLYSNSIEHAAKQHHIFLEFLYFTPPGCFRWLEKRNSFLVASAFTNMHSNMPTTHTTYVCVRIQISDSVVSGWNFFLTCVSETILIAVKCSITWEFRSIRFCCLLFIFRGFCASASLIFCYLLRQTPCINVKMNRRPIVTGTSVIGITYKGGVMLAADTLGPFAKSNIPACSLLFRCQLCMFCWLSRFVRLTVPFQEADSYQSNWGPDTHRGWGRSQ